MFRKEGNKNMFKEMLKKRMQGKKKGFTLIEVIVVLVILAILAAIAVPALTGYIDKANQRAVLSEARNIQVAIQEIASDAYGSGASEAQIAAITSDSVVIAGTSNVLGGKYVPISTVAAPTLKDEIKALSGQTVDGTLTLIKFDGKAVKKFLYTKTDGKTVYYLSGNYTTSEPSGWAAA
ncbi:MAG: type II secretion system GspH family protein [Clostridiales Family XIII bacterium]|jgi:prepilin-type N-terminal cleavage/methylation domain-containing protein|nr:type II secretion system GspH family protein [Clostridiales Family XIII bacterium]